MNGHSNVMNVHFLSNVDGISKITSTRTREKCLTNANFVIFHLVPEVHFLNIIEGIIPNSFQNHYRHLHTSAQRQPLVDTANFSKLWDTAYFLFFDANLVDLKLGEINS